MSTRGHQKGEGVSATVDPAPCLPPGIAPVSPTEPLQADRRAAGPPCRPPEVPSGGGRPRGVFALLLENTQILVSLGAAFYYLLVRIVRSLYCR